MVSSLEKSPSPEAVETGRKKILVLEDDVEFQSIIQEYLELNEYDVVAVPNGADGIREIIACDFETIVCDMNMPNLPGDMFYLAVERMRPHLCKRFIFITGFNGAGKTADFINRISGTVLRKPFHVDDLLDLISFVRIRSALALAS